jgi:hypothetical protein
MIIKSITSAPTSPAGKSGTPRSVRRLLKALKPILLTLFDYAQDRPTPKTEAAKLAHQIFRRVLGEDELAAEAAGS